jgi:hypothetical protein
MASPVKEDRARAAAIRARPRRATWGPASATHVYLAEAQRDEGVRRVEEALLRPESLHQPDLDDEHNAEEKGEALQRLLSSPLEKVVVDAVDADAEHVKQRCLQHRHEQRVEAEGGADDDHGKGAGDHQRRVGDVDDVEHAEGHRQARGREGVEAAEQQAADDAVQQQLKVGVHPPAQAPGGP